MLTRNWNHHFCGYGKGLCENFGGRGDKVREKMDGAKRVTKVEG